MKTKIVSIIMVVVMLFTLMSASISASAIFNNDIRYGDVDGNDVIDTADARLALMAAAGLGIIDDEDAFDRADINNDGFVTLFDARQILRGVTGLVALQPDGAFSGFTGYSDGNINVSSPEAAIAVFNTCLNRVKTEFPGFTRSEATDITDFNIKEVNLVGINFGNSAESVAQLVKDMIVSETEPEEAQIIVKGTNSYNAMSAEGEDYVSKLTVDDVYGIEVTYDIEGYMTIKVALPDSELDNLSQTPYAKAFNTDIIQEDSDSVLQNVFESNTSEDAKTKNAENAVLTLVIDTTGNVVSYSTTYETSMYLVNSTFGVSSVLSAELKGVTYGTKVTVTYDNFQW
ncbi:MAG: dockerin type I repeat-containing protein [Clostridia bacterium]|nr:dockerin type I repeat-containing protein [Clostridia bacterium]